MDTRMFEPPEGLLQRILVRLRIEERRLRAAKRDIMVFGMIAVGSLGAFIPAYRTLAADVASSGLRDFLRLAISDSAIVAVLWREFAFSILESLPVVSAAVICAVVLASVASMRMIATSFEKIMGNRLTGR